MLAGLSGAAILCFMRILLLNDRIPPENRGGAGAVVWRLAQALHHAGHAVHVVAATPGDTFNEIRDGIPTWHLHSRYPARFRAWLSLYNPQTSRPLRRLYAQIQPDVVNAHNVHTDLGYHSLTLAHRAGLPTVFTSHDVMLFAYHKLSHFIDPAMCGVRTPDDYRLPPGFNRRQMRFRYNPLRNVIIRRILTRHADCRTVPSRALADAHAANDLPPFEVVHNGIDADSFSVSPEVIAGLRDRLNLQGRRVILFAGRLTQAKGTQQLLAALQQVVTVVPDVCLLVLSSQSIESQVQQPEYADLRARHLVSGGWLSGDDLMAAFHLADVVTVPSVIFDTFPTVILEAMAAGTPVLATCYGGSPEAVREGETGYIINPFETADFAARLIRILRDDDLRQRMGENAARHVRQNLSLDQQVAAMLRVYQRAQAQH